MKIHCVILLLFSLYSCNTKKDFIKYTEQDKADSVFYFKDFDLISFKGIHQLSTDSLEYPFVKMIYADSGLTLKAHFSEKKTHQVNFFRLQNKWCMHYWHYADGRQLHSLLISLDTALLELTYANDPLHKTGNVTARLSEVSIKTMSKDTVLETMYINFFDDDIAVVPELNKLNTSNYARICNEIIDAKNYIRNDSVVGGYLSNYTTPHYAVDEKNDWSWSSSPLLYHSRFYTDFIKMKDGDTNLTLQEKLDNIKEMILEHQRK